MALLLGIDIGTSSVKAVLFDSDTSQIVAVQGAEYPIHKPAPNRAEQDPDDWWRASVSVIRAVMARAPHTAIAGISLSGQMHGTALVDAAGRPVGRAIIWADQRSAEVLPELIARVGAAEYSAIAGTLPAAGFMGPTLMWLARHEPERLERAHRALLPKDYVQLRLTGEMSTELSDAASTSLLDVTRRQWSPELVRAAEVPEDLLPPVLESSAVAGQLSRDAADELGLAPGVPVIAGCGDQPAQAIANGLVSPGRASVTIGSGGQVLVPLQGLVNGKVPTDERLHVFNHAVPDTWYTLGATLSAGLSLRWFRDLCGLGDAPDAYAQFSAAADAVGPGADGLLFLPHLSGERTPHMDPLARGAFIGLNYHHGRGHLARAIMEGVTFSMRHALEISLELAGAVDEVIAAGGAAESPVWRQIQADVIGVPLRKSLLVEQAGVGAAVLAGVGAGVYASFDEAVSQVARYDNPTLPHPEHHARYNDLYAHYLSLFPRLQGDFHRLSGF